MKNISYKECPHYRKSKEQEEKECDGNSIWGAECEGSPYCKF
ncbi:MAG TPA: hypothetical protein VHP38_02190 [Ruminiclostridium sp.]|nr:hypothetical protein [Ruminiclostridium sp.]